MHEYLNLILQLIKGNSGSSGGVSIITSGDFLQLPPVMSRAAFQPPRNIGYNSLRGKLWVQLFKTWAYRDMETRQ